MKRKKKEKRNSTQHIPHNRYRIQTPTLLHTHTHRPSDDDECSCSHSICIVLCMCVHAEAMRIFPACIRPFYERNNDRSIRLHSFKFNTNVRCRHMTGVLTAFQLHATVACRHHTRIQSHRIYRQATRTCTCTIENSLRATNTKQHKSNSSARFFLIQVEALRKIL